MRGIAPGKRASISVLVAFTVIFPASSSAAAFPHSTGSTPPGVSAPGLGTASAATINVNTTADEVGPGDGFCSLREAIAAVDSPGTASDCGSASSSGNTIVLAAGHYPLWHPGALHILGTATGLTISGAGQGSTKIDATGLGDRVLTIDAGAGVTLKGLTLTGGHAPDGTVGTTGSPGNTGTPGGPGGDGANGGGILNGGSLTVIDSAVTNNVAGTGGAGGAGGTSPNGGGGVGGAGGRGGAGGGIYNTGTLTLTGATVSGNHAGDGGVGGAGGQSGDLGGAGGNGGCCGDGGGIANAGGNVMVTNSTIAGNSAGAGGKGGDGGDGFNNGGAAGNGYRGARGGGISSVGGSISVTNSTIASNTAGAGGNGGNGGSAAASGSKGGNAGNGGNGGDGGGVRFYSATGNIASATVAANDVGQPGAAGTAGTGSTAGTGGTAGSAGDPGGVFIESPPAATLQDSIVASNTGGNCLSVGTPISDGGHNLSFGDTTCPGSNGDPKLGALQDNGGPTPTMALRAGSAATDQVPATGAGCLPSDQRGVPRPSGPACDTGAYEVAPPVVTTGGATSITSSKATLNGSITPNAGAANIHFEYGTSTSYGSTTPVQQVGGVTALPVAATISGLPANTTIHYRLVAASPDGSQAGSDHTVTTGSRPTLNVAKGGSGSGTVTSSPAGIDCGATCSAHFGDGTVVTVTATAAAGSIFTGWLGDCSGTGTCQLTMSTNHSVTATFRHLCVVPKLKGKKLRAAKRAITKANCSVGKVKRAFSSRVKKGRVMSQKPRPGKKLPPGSRVQLKVSKGRRP